DMGISAGHILPALAALLLALGTRFLLAYSLSLLAFWTQQSGALLSVNDTLFFLLAGQVAPVALFPGVLQQLSLLLPYRYMLSFPVEVLTGTLSGQELVWGLGMQALWLAVLTAVYLLISRQGVHHYSAAGG
ncbi:MAG: hypothetical protein K0Q90_1592, partial [Paenibacillaceae bacterium]|nr:hypothetical protein [Paenibacillaceae bacterium]